MICSAVRSQRMALTQEAHKWDDLPLSMKQSSASPFMGESFRHDAVIAHIRRAVDCPVANWIGRRVLALTRWPRLDSGCARRPHRVGFTYLEKINHDPEEHRG